MIREKVVIKYGGSALDDRNLRDRFCSGLIELVEENYEITIVHGGGPQISSLLKQLGIESRFVNGLRVTDNITMQVVEMVLCGSVNKFLVRMLQKRDLRAVGISGQDDNLMSATQIDPEFGHVGEVDSVQPAILKKLMAMGIIPVVAPVALDINYKPINVNGDFAAAAIAAALRADSFIIISDVPGVYDKNKNVYHILTGNECRVLLATEVITGGMIPKLSACLEAVDRGCHESIILDGSVPGSLVNALLHKKIAGTVIIPD